MINVVSATVLHAGDSVLITLSDNGWLLPDAREAVVAEVAEAFPGVRLTLVNGATSVLVYRGGGEPLSGIQESETAR